MNTEPIIEALMSSLRIAAIILPLFYIIDYLNHKYGHEIKKAIEKSEKLMPLLGGTLGLLPGCNVAVVTAVLYSEGIASLGTLVATIIATSDEAIYVFIPLGFNFFPLIVAKFIIAVCTGYFIDLIYHKYMVRNKKGYAEIDFCCVEHPHTHDGKAMFVHTLKHGTRIVLIVFAVLSILNYIQDYFGLSSINNFFNGIDWLQPVITGLIGLVPGCGTSVAIATLYSKGIITFGAAVAGLSTASGEALIVLYARGINKIKLAEIAALVFFVSVIGGYLAQLFI